MEAYYVDENMYYKGQYKLNINLNIYDVMCAAGPIDTSFNILAARLMGLDYHIFLQYIRQEFELSSTERMVNIYHIHFQAKLKLIDLARN